MFDNLCIDNRLSIFDNQRLMINIWQGALSWKQLIFGSKAKSLNRGGCNVSQSLSKSLKWEGCTQWSLSNTQSMITIEFQQRDLFCVYCGKILLWKNGIEKWNGNWIFSIDEMRVRTVGLSSFTPALGQRSIWTIQPSWFQFYSWSGRSG